MNLTNVHAYHEYSHDHFSCYTKNTSTNINININSSKSYISELEM